MDVSASPSRAPFDCAPGRDGRNPSVGPAGPNGWHDATAEGLEADNTRAYWSDHKDVYERDVKGPMEALLAELAGEFGARFCGPAGPSSELQRYHLCDNGGPLAESLENCTSPTGRRW